MTKIFPNVFKYIKSEIIQTHSNISDKQFSKNINIFIQKCISRRYIQQHLLNGNLVAGGVDDEEVAINGDEEDGEGGEEDTGGLNDSGQLAKDFLKVKIEN